MASEFDAFVLTHAPAGIFVTDLEGRFAHWTESATALFGYAASETAGCPLEALIDPDGSGQASATRPGDSEDFEAVRRRKDGSLPCVDACLPNPIEPRTFVDQARGWMRPGQGH